jgi:hypothetical protein
MQNYARCFLAASMVFVVVSAACAQSTPRFDLPLLAPRQAQPDVTINEAMARIDAFLLPRLSEYPLSVTDTATISNFDQDEGALFIVPRNATGAFENQDDALALILNQAWEFLEPEPGWRVLEPITEDSFDAAQAGAAKEVIYSGTQHGWVDASVIVHPRVAINFDSYAQWITRTAGVHPLSVQTNVTGVPAALFHLWGGSSVTIGGQFPYTDPNAWAVEVKNATGQVATSIRDDGALTGLNQSTAPAGPPNNSWRIWADDSGDVYIDVDVGGVTKTSKIVDFSSL